MKNKREKRMGAVDEWR